MSQGQVSMKINGQEFVFNSHDNNSVHLPIQNCGDFYCRGWTQPTLWAIDAIGQLWMSFTPEFVLQHVNVDVFLRQLNFARESFSDGIRKAEVAIEQLLSVKGIENGVREPKAGT